MNKILKMAILIIVAGSSMQALAEKIQQIQVTGNQRIEKSTILEYLHINIGDTYTPATRSNAVKNLYSTSFFENINITFDNGTLNIAVTETCFISEVVFTGNNKLKTKLLEKEIYTAAGDGLNEARLRADVEKIKEIYKRSGRFSAQVKSKIEPQENNRIKVIFDISEGPKAGIQRINFVGNENYTDSELQSTILTNESKWFKFFDTNDTYDPERIDFDKYLLTQFYNSVGFADFRVISVTADLLTTKEGFVLTYSIEEGQKYTFGKTTLNNTFNHILDNEILQFIDNNEGETFNIKVLQKTTETIADYLASKGYPYVDVQHKLHPDVAKARVDVEIVVNQAAKVFINQININGNIKTEDHVIRRQLKIAEGDVYNKNKILRGERSIRNLDYFGKMNLSLAPTEDEDRYDINIDVEEKSTSSIGLDLGYNTSGGPFGRISFLERNLIGTGRQLEAGIQVGNKSLYYSLGLADPNFMDKDLLLGGTVFLREDGSGSGFSNGEHKYSSKSTGVKILLGYDINNDLSHDIEYMIKTDHLKTTKDKASSIFIKEQMGKFLTSSIENTLTYDKTDSRIIPKNGYILSGSQTWAGLGGNVKFLKHDLEGKFYKSFVDNKYTIKFGASAGHITGISGKKVMISDRFNIGDYSLRGFSQGGIGPRDKKTEEGLGGQTYYTLSTELSFPLGLPEDFNVTGSVFADAGSLWDADSKTEEGFYNSKSMRASVGFGVLWMTRMAPIRLDWAFPMLKKKYDEKQTFHIKFSTNF
ncbi:MAG: outer membrane protein assembly factor BamA [Rickettsiaceae bacterium]